MLTGDGDGVSLGTKSLSSPLSKGEIIGSTGITLLDFLVRSVGTFFLSHFLSFQALNLLLVL